MELKGGHTPFNPQAGTKVTQFWCSGVHGHALHWDPCTVDVHVCPLQLLLSPISEDFGKEEWGVKRSAPRCECLYLAVGAGWVHRSAGEKLPLPPFHTNRHT